MIQYDVDFQQPAKNALKKKSLIQLVFSEMWRKNSSGYPKYDLAGTTKLVRFF